MGDTSAFVLGGVVGGVVGIVVGYGLSPVRHICSDDSEHGVSPLSDYCSECGAEVVLDFDIADPSDSEQAL